MTEEEWICQNGFAKVSSSGKQAKFSKSVGNCVTITLIHYRNPIKKELEWQCSISIGIELASAYGITFRQAMNVASAHSKSEIAKIHETVNEL
jgi:hypothetical protein